LTIIRLASIITKAIKIVSDQFIWEDATVIIAIFRILVAVINIMNANAIKIYSTDRPSEDVISQNIELQPFAIKKRKIRQGLFKKHLGFSSKILYP